MGHIFKISEAATLALHTMVFLAYKNTVLVCTRDIAELFDVSEAHLAKVLQRLSKSGLVKPERGPKGGFRLARQAEKISLLEIYEIFDGRFETEQCLLGSYICGGKDCILGELLHNNNIRTKKYLEDTKVSALVNICDGLKGQPNKT